MGGASAPNRKEKGVEMEWRGTGGSLSPAKKGGVQEGNPRKRVARVPEEKGASLFLYDSSGTLERGTFGSVKRYDWRRA